MSKLNSWLIITLLALSTPTIRAEESRLMRFPTVHGNRVVFTYAGDLYTVPIEGGTASRLTSHVGFEMFAKFSPDGKTIAFTGQYDGNTEVFTIPSQGGEPKRLTHTATLDRDDVSDRMGPNNIVMAWAPDGKSIVYRSRKQSFNSFVGQLFTVPLHGGPSTGVPLSTGGFCSFSPNGMQLAFNRVFREFRTWKYYAGGMADDIWIFDFSTKQTKNITNRPSQDIIPMWIGNEIFFISDRYRTMNLFVHNITTGETQQVTHYTDYDIKFPSHNGSTIVFERGGYLYSLDAPSRSVKQIPVTIANDFPFARTELKDASTRIFSTDVAPDGSRVVFSARGDIFTVPSENGITRNLTSSSNAHERSAVWSPDGKHIAYLSDKSGEYEIYIQEQDGQSAPIQLTKGDEDYKYSLQWSPDSKKILWNGRKGKLQLIDIESRKLTLVAKSEFGLINSYTWSPDSRWIAYSMDGANRFSAIHLFGVENGERIVATDGWFDASQPSFSRDGKYLLFVSDRDFEPIYSRTEWNHAYDSMSRVYITILSADTPSPFAPKNDEVKVEDSQPSRSKSRSKEKPDESKVTPADVIVRIDPIGLAQRTIALPHAVANYWNIQCIDDKIYYNRWTQGSSANTMHLFDLKTRKEELLAEGVTFNIAENGTKMLVAKGDSYAVIDLPTARFTIDKPMSLTGMSVWVDYRQEWQQIYDESWRQMRDFFYVENLHGVDWKAMYNKYNVLIPHVNHRADLTYVIGELIGELAVGHAYVNSGEMPTPPRVKMGLLGAQVSKHPSGFFRIDSILEGANWSESLRSPLLNIGVSAKAGDFIIAVDGQTLTNTPDLYSTLIGKANRTVELTINNKPEVKGSRKVLVTPIADESNLYYYSWVQRNIRRVSEATNGQVGYIHIPDMMDEGLNEFAKHFYPQLNRKGLIIDNRGNGGGNVSPMILERLNREVFRANMRRGFKHPNPVPSQTHIGPKVLLIDRYSASDGDLFAHGFRKLGIGPIIGTRTWGGVVGIAGTLPFVDGGDLRKPEFASFCSTTGQWLIEGYGVDPDIHLDNDPYSEYRGYDAQLEKAIEVILESLKDWKGLPPIPTDPDKSK